MQCQSDICICTVLPSLFSNSAITIFPTTHKGIKRQHFGQADGGTTEGIQKFAEPSLHTKKEEE